MRYIPDAEDSKKKKVDRVSCIMHCLLLRNGERPPKTRLVPIKLHSKLSILKKKTHKHTPIKEGERER